MEETNPYDTTSEEQEIELLQKELNDSLVSIESDFAKYMAERTDSELEELFFEDKEAFYAKILTEQNQFVEEKINSKQGRIQELGASVEKKRSFAAIEEAQEAFLQSHPDADINAMMSYYQEELRPRERAELDSLPPLEFFEALYKLMQGGEEETQEAPSKLPKQLSGVEVGADMSARDMDESLPNNRY